MPSERRSKEDTWTPNELKKALGKDAIKKEREDRKRERLRDDQNGEEKTRRKRDVEETRDKRAHRDEDERRHHKEKDRHHRNDDDGRRRKRDSPERITEDDRERQRRERREKKEGKTKDDDRRRRPEEEDDSKRRRHKDDDREKDERRRHRDDDEKRKHRDDDDRRKHRDGDERRRHRDDDDKERRRHRDDDEKERRRHKDEDGDRKRHRDDDDRDRRKHRDDDERDRRKEKKDRDRQRDEEDDREKQRRERREKKEGKDKDRDREKDRERRNKDDDSKTNGKSKVPVKEEEEENDNGDYEDDFEDYEEDFEEDEDEAPTGKDDEMNQVLRALDQENDRLYKDSKKKESFNRYDRSDSPNDNDHRRGYRDSSPDEPASRPRPRTAINFQSAKRRVMSQQAYGKTSKRAQDLLQMIELDTVTFDIMDLPPVKEYELYIISYGRSDTRQAYVQTNDDAIDRDIQTEEIDMRSKWTQHPAEDFLGSGRGDGEKDFEEEEQSQQNKQQDLSRLSKFIQQAGQVVSILLDEERSQDKTELSANKSNISMSEGYTELSMLSILEGRHVESAYFAPTQPNMLLTIYSQPEESNPANPAKDAGIICVWNTNEPSYPQRILACESQPRCCCFSPYKTSVAFAGMVDGSICAWDLREPPSLHKSVEYDKLEHLLRFPTYNTAGILESENHISPVTTINPVITYLDENTQDSGDDSGSGMSFQLVSSEDQGRIHFWVVAELSSSDQSGSEIDLGLSPGGKIKVVISSVIKLENLIREARLLAPVRSFEMQISPKDPNHFYIGTDGGYVLHGLRFGNRAFPRTFSALTDSPVDVKTIDFSPFGHPCFLATTADGSVHLFGSKSDKPLLSWPSKIWGTKNIICARWSRCRPCVFYVLDDRSQLYTFDLLEIDAMPSKMEPLSRVRVKHIAFTSYIKVTGRLPQMLVSLEDGTVQIHTIAKDYREQQTLENDFLPSYLDKF